MMNVISYLKDCLMCTKQKTRGQRRFHQTGIQFSSYLNWTLLVRELQCHSSDQSAVTATDVHSLPVLHFTIHHLYNFPVQFTVHCQIINSPEMMRLCKFCDTPRGAILYSFPTLQAINLNAPFLELENCVQHFCQAAGIFSNFH